MSLLQVHCVCLVILFRLTNSFTIPDYSFVYKKPPDWSIFRSEYAGYEFNQLTWHRILLISLIISFLLSIVCCYCLRHVVIKFIINRSDPKIDHEQLTIVHHIVPMKNVETQYLTIPNSHY